MLALTLQGHFQVAGEPVSEVIVNQSKMPMKVEPGHFLYKRSAHAALACSSHNGITYDDHHMVLHQHYYRWLEAECDRSVSPSHFRVKCDHTIVTAGSTEVQETYQTGDCPEGLQCFPEENGINFRGEVAKDISCNNPVADIHYDADQEGNEDIGPQKDRPSTFCSKVITIPQSGGPGFFQSGGGTKRRRQRHRRLFTLEVDVRLSNGAKFIASELYILDVSSRYPWRRSDQRKVSANSADLVVVGDTIRKIKFCMVLAAGYGYSVLFHHVAKEVRGIQQNDPRLLIEDHLQDIIDGAQVPTVGGEALSQPSS